MLVKFWESWLFDEGGIKPVGKLLCIFLLFSGIGIFALPLLSDALGEIPISFLISVTVGFFLIISSAEIATGWHRGFYVLSDDNNLTHSD